MTHNAENATLLRVYPLPGGSCELQGLFLAHPLRERAAAGPRVHSALLRAGRLDRLYLTLAQLMLGGEDFDTPTTGDYFSPVPGFSLAELYVDTVEPDGVGQLFAVLDRR